MLKVNKKINDLYKDKDYFTRTQIIILFWLSLSIFISMIPIIVHRIITLGTYFFPALYIELIVSSISILFIYKKKHKISVVLLSISFIVAITVGFYSNYMRQTVFPNYGSAMYYYIFPLLIFLLFYIKTSITIVIFIYLFIVSFIYQFMLSKYLNIYRPAEFTSYFTSLVICIPLSVLIIKSIKNHLNEKNILLKELHHRVKNNLEVITSLLSSQINYTEDEILKEKYSSVVNKIFAISFVHEEHYYNERLNKIDLKHIIDNIADRLILYDNKNGFKIIFNNYVEDVFLSINTSIPISIIINELITYSIKETSNSNKHKLNIDISSKVKNKQIIIIYRDNINNKSSKISKFNEEDPEMKIIKILCNQIDAKISFLCNNNREVLIEFLE